MTKTCIYNCRCLLKGTFLSSNPSLCSSFFSFLTHKQLVAKLESVLSFRCCLYQLGGQEINLQRGFLHVSFHLHMVPLPVIEGHERPDCQDHWAIPEVKSESDRWRSWWVKSKLVLVPYAVVCFCLNRNKNVQYPASTQSFIKLNKMGKEEFCNGWWGYSNMVRHMYTDKLTVYIK